VYNFAGITSQPSFSTHQGSFQSTLDGFKNLTNRSKIDVKPDRIRLKQAKRQGTCKAAFLSLGVKKDDLEKVALMNGRELADNIPAGTLLKVLEKGR
jgi:predicted Zn-dependent protease